VKEKVLAAASKYALQKASFLAKKINTEIAQIHTISKHSVSRFGESGLEEMFVLGSRTRRPPSKSKDVTYDF
jgi:uncharacterized protein YggE